MDEPQKSQFYPEWSHWARWAGLLAIWGTFFILYARTVIVATWNLLENGTSP